MRLTCAGGWLQRWMHWGGRGAIVCRCSSSRTDSPFIRMYEEVDYERRLSTMVRRYCRHLDEVSILPSEITSHVDLCCMNIPFSSAWFVQRSAFWASDLDFKTRCSQSLLNTAVRVLVELQNVELFTARPLDWWFLPVGVEDLDWGAFTTHRLLGVPIPPVFSYYSCLVLSMIDDYRHLVGCIALTEFAVSTVMRFLCRAHSGVT